MNRKPSKTLELAGRRPAQDLALAEAALDCAGFDLTLAEVLRRSDLPPAARIHLHDCPGCAAKLDDIEAIADSLRLLSSAASAPVPDQWSQIRAVLLQEGIIHANGRACPQTPAAPKLVKK